jgi:dienelactone hydrolase
MPLTAGSHLGRYQIIDLLGAGGMGMVYRAHDDRLQRDVAIKVLPPSVLADDDARRRFRKEALALAKLSHPNIAAIYDVGEEGDTAYLVMECVSGESLATRLAREPLSLTDALAVSSQIADALADAHEQGVVHRDLKPANVMLSRKGQVKVLDFGLAKLLTPSDASTATLSRADMGGGAGTPLYMSPEQAFGESVDARTDLWSLGVVLFESLTGTTPFHGATDWALLNSVSHDAPPTLRSLRPELPPSVESIVSRALSKDAAARYQTAGAMQQEIVAVQQSLSAPRADVEPRTIAARPMTVVAIGAVLAVALCAAAWAGLGWSHRNWARTQAPPQIQRLILADLHLAAFQELRRAQQYLPRDTTLTRLANANIDTVAVRSTPSGAKVEIQDYLSPDSAWEVLGTTPFANVAVPTGYFRWRVTPPAGQPVVTAPMTGAKMNFALDSGALAPAGMVHVPARGYQNYIAFIGWVGPYRMPPFDIDRYEVTNREYQQFVDSGGYRNRALWREPFVDQGKPVTWDSAMARFRDKSGRPGPSTWAGGHFPDGQADYPVSGISWYEASAYAAFRGKALPVMAQWHEVAPPDAAPFIGALSNMSHEHVAAVGAFKGVGPYGTYDMAGNVREWVLNATETGDRFILGGGWSSPYYLYAMSEALPPFDRSALNGARNVRNLGSLPADASATVHRLQRDFSHFTPASDAVFHAYQAIYDYDKTPLDARDEGTVQQTADWTLKKVSFNAAYNGERITGYLYLPAHVKPPYQTMLFFPSARVLGRQSSATLGDVEFFDYVVQSGRAVFYPVYQDTYERRLRGSMPGASQELRITAEQAKDVARALDYLQSRPDIDHDKLGYMGVSMGAAQGAIYATLQQDRLRAVVLLDGGYFLDKPPAGGDQADFVPRLKKPVLMVNGRYDETFSYEGAQQPLFQMLGTPAADKRKVDLEAAHDVTAQRSILVREVLAWLDKYLGRVE